MTTYRRMSAEQYRRERERDEQGRPRNARPRDRYGWPLPREAVDELGARVEPEEVVDSSTAAFERAVELFDDQRFFEAHEFLEYVWKSAEIPDGDRNFWKGVTQVAVGCVHTQRGNDVGAVRLLERAIDYLRPYPSPYQGVDKAALEEAARSVADQVRARGASPKLSFPVFPRATLAPGTGSTRSCDG